MIGDRERLLLKVFHDYYVRNLTQAEIAARHLISRKKVQRFLEEGRSENLVEVTIKFPSRMYGQLESELEDRFSLREAIVADLGDADAVTTRNVGEMGADYFLRVLSNRNTVFFAWSGHIAEMLDSASRKVAGLREKPKDIRFVLTPGGMIGMEPDVETLEAGSRLSQALNARLSVLMAPGLTSSSATRRALLEDPQIAAILEASKKADLAFFGVGSIDGDSRIVPAARKFFPGIIEKLKKAGAVGDINGHFFDADGRPVASDLDDRMISLDIADIKAMKLAVGIGAGPSKFVPFRALLSAGVFDAVITDVDTARRLVEK